MRIAQQYLSGNVFHHEYQSIAKSAGKYFHGDAFVPFESMLILLGYLHVLSPGACALFHIFSCTTKRGTEGGTMEQQPLDKTGWEAGSIYIHSKRTTAPSRKTVPVLLAIL